MDDTVRNLNNEELIMDWLIYGIPDHNDVWELEDYLEYIDEDYEDIWNAFEDVMCCAVAEEEDIPVEWKEYIEKWKEMYERKFEG